MPNCPSHSPGSNVPINGDTSYHRKLVSSIIAWKIQLSSSSFTEQLHLWMHRKVVHINTIARVDFVVPCLYYVPLRSWMKKSQNEDKWFRMFSTTFQGETAALLMFAKYILQYSPASWLPEWIPGKINIEGDNLPRLYLLFTSSKKVIHDLTFDSLLPWICLKYIVQGKIPGSVKKWKVPGNKCIATVKPKI